jgi:hypothetical protein
LALKGTATQKEARREKIPENTAISSALTVVVLSSDDDI